MALKFPSQNKLQYVSGGAISNDGWTQYGYLNLAKDLSIVNRRGYAQTDNQGVPWVFRCRFTTYPQDEDGFGFNAAVGSDFATTLKIDGCQNNWVLRNGAVKWHAAREGQFRAAKISKKQRGAYAGTIRYMFDGNTQTWLVPIDGDGDSFAGGTWDETQFTTGADDSFVLKLVGIGVDESSTGAATAWNVAHSYLNSRATVPADSNLESSSTPAEHSILREMILDSSGSRLSDSRTDDLMDDAQDQQDNPPYDEFLPGDTNHDITEPVELGRCVTGVANGIGQVIVDIPFGLASLKATHYDAADTAITTDFTTCVEVLDIFPMQG